MYMPSNASNIIEGNSDSDTSVSVVASAASITGLQYSVDVLKAPVEQQIAPLTVLLLYWQASVSRPEFPLMVNTLIDHSSHAVLISEEFAAATGLK